MIVWENHTSYDFVSGPWGVIQLWRLAPPGRNPSTLAWRNKCVRHRLNKTKFWLNCPQN